MYHVLLVDDEPRALVGMQKTFQWEREGFTVIAAVTDSLAALDILQHQHPEVVFTDIKMPALSGLQLLQQARRMGLDTEFIIVSGYAEFDYAREALQQGAFDYCLKPLDFEEADRLLERLAVHMRAKTQRNDTAAFERLLQIRPGADGWQTPSLGLPCAHPFYQGIVLLHDAKSVADERWLAQPGQSARLFRLSPGKTFAIVNCNTSDGVSGEPEDHPDTCLGVSTVSAEPNLQKLYREANVAAHTRMLTQRDGFYRYHPRNFTVVHTVVKTLRQELGQRDAMELRRVLDGLPALFIKENLTMEDAAYLWNRLLALTLEEMPQSRQDQPLDFTTWEQLVQDYADMPSLCASLGCALEAHLGVGPSPEDSAEGSVSFRRLLLYINEHYAEKLYLRDLSKQFYINESYCCTLFRKVTGLSFSEYVLRLRMTRAKELLDRDHSSIGEIALLVGYDDCYYFSKVYKKHFGTTATAHRRMGREIRQAGL